MDLGASHIVVLLGLPTVVGGQWFPQVGVLLGEGWVNTLLVHSQVVVLLLPLFWSAVGVVLCLVGGISVAVFGVVDSCNLPEACKLVGCPVCEDRVKL